MVDDLSAVVGMVGLLAAPFLGAAIPSCVELGSDVWHDRYSFDESHPSLSIPYNEGFPEVCRGINTDLDACAYKLLMDGSLYE